MRQLQKIFSFTFLQHIRTKVYRNVTIGGILLLLLLPAVIMPLMERLGGKEIYISQVEKVYVIDTDTAHPVDYHLLNTVGAAPFDTLEYVSVSSLEEAQWLAEKETHTVFLAVKQENGQYLATVLLPEETELKKRDATEFEAFLSTAFRMVLIEKSGLSPEKVAEAAMPLTISTHEEIKDEAGESEDGYASMRNLLAQILPYLNIMLLYFMVLAYGQGTANSAIMEKTSKLMDTFLVSVKPGNMLLGKVFAMALCGIVQLGSWIAALTAGFAVGTYLTRRINPNTDMAIIRLFDGFGQMSGLFTVQGVILAFLMLAAGFLLYCSLAAIGGALAGKPEDLSNTNILFVFVLLASFFATLYAGGVDADVPWQASAISWQAWIPFTAILVMPTRMLLGMATLPQSLISLGIVIAATVLLTLFAGRLYKMMSLYKGNPPGPKKILEMLKRKS